MSRTCSLALALLFASSLKSGAQTIAVTPGQDADKVEQLGFPTSYTGQPPTNSPFTYSVTWSIRQTDCTPPSNFGFSSTVGVTR